MTRFLLLALALAWVPAAGCAQLGYQLFGVGHTRSNPYRGSDQDRIWTLLQEAVNDYYDIRLADDEDRYLETEWKEQLGPMYKTGRRFRVRAWVRADDETGTPFLEVTVDRQINDNMDRPLSKSEADWETDWDAGGRDVARENRIVWLVNFRLKQIEPSKEALENRPSEYSRDPEEKAREDLWGKKKEGEAAPRDLWK